MCSIKAKGSFIVFSLIFTIIGFSQTNQTDVPSSNVQHKMDAASNPCRIA